MVFSLSYGIMKNCFLFFKILMSLYKIYNEKYMRF